MSPPKRPQVKKPVKRLSPNQRNGNGHKMVAPAIPKQTLNDYHNDLVNFLALRNKNTNNNYSSSASEISSIPSQELIWIRDDSNNRPPNDRPPIEFPELPSPAGPSTNVVRIDDEIEDGEIVETEVTGIVNLLAESFAAVTKSKKLVDLTSPFKQDLFYEDRSKSTYGTVPRYKAFGDGANVSMENDDVICLDSTQENDDSVIFVSEEKQTPVTKKKVGRLVTPDCLKTPALNKILGLAAPAVTKSVKTKSPKKKLRLALWKEKKAAEFAAINAQKAAEQKKSEAVASTSSALSSSAPSTSQQAIAKASATSKEREKRIILIDGSNMAMGYTDNYGSKKTDKDFSAEGLRMGIEHFEQLGFQVKAIVPEFRLRREKSSNQAIMRQLQETGKLVCTPSKSYDDRVILESAVRLDAAVVSNDHYRDLLNEKPEFKEVVSRLIRFNWLFQKLIIPEDPHGRDGPKLQDILYKKT